jgi:NAD-dependent dihydropyrimidine dehydrogenase PreA subunit/nitroreductase
MIVVDKQECTGCGSCVKICHEDCMALDNGTVAINYELCSTCSQCIAICPRRALSWDGVAPVAFDETRLPTPEQLDELLKQRRTIRFFKPEKLDRALLKEIVGYGIHSPTNNYALRAIVVDDRQIMDALERVHLQFVSRVYNLFFRSKTAFNLLRKLTPTLDPKDKVKMKGVLERGDDFCHPPAIVFIVGDKRIALSEASVQYALYNMILYAQTKGIGSRLKGIGQIIFDRSRRAKERLGLQKHEHILGMLELGYPAVKFRNKVEGKTLSLQWNGG